MKQLYWFADDASGAGSITEIMTPLDTLSTLGPDFGYFPNDRKCWIIAKPTKEESVREAFKGTSINVTVHGQKHLGAVISSLFRGICQRKGDQLDQWNS